MERLTPEEFVIDTALQQRLAAEGEARYERLKRQLLRQMRAMEVREGLVGAGPTASRASRLSHHQPLAPAPVPIP